MVGTCQDLVNVAAAPVFDHAPHRALRQVQQVVVCPESHQHHHGELHDLQALPQRSVMMLCKCAREGNPAHASLGFLKM